MPSNLVAFHLDELERAGVVLRRRSEGARRPRVPRRPPGRNDTRHDLTHQRPTPTNGAPHGRHEQQRTRTPPPGRGTGAHHPRRDRAEVGIDIADSFPRPWTDESVGVADVIVSMGCGDACPVLPGTRYLDGDLEDPAGRDVAAVRPIRDDIERRVRDLMTDLGIDAA